MIIERFRAVLDQHGTPVSVRRPQDEKFVTLKLYGQGAIQRLIGDGKTPKPFTGYRVRSGQFIYSRIDARNGAFGIVPKELDGAVVSKDFPVFDIDTSRIDPRYLLATVTAPAFSKKIQQLSFGATNRQRVKEDVFLNLDLPLPSLADQRRIATILDKADELRTKRRQALILLDALARSIFHSMFVDPVQVRPVFSVEELAADIPSAIRTGPFGSQLLTSEFTDEGIAVLGIDNAVNNKFVWKQRRFISEEKYADLKRYTVRPGDFIVTIMGTLGRCAVIPEDIPVAINTKHLCCITLDRNVCLPEFLQYYFLNHPTAKGFLGQTTKGSIMGGLNMGIIKNLPVELPSVEEQRIFTARVASVERLKDAHRVQLAELDAMFDSLQHRAFKGEL